MRIHPGKAFHRTPPIRVVVNRTLSPIEAILITPTRGITLEGVEVSETHLDENLLPLRGGLLPMSNVNPENGIKLFLWNTTPPPNLSTRNIYPIHLDSKNTLLLHISWSGTSGHLKPGQLGLLWSAVDRQAGLPPFIYTSGSILGIAKRAKEIGRRDNRRQFRKSRVGALNIMQQNAPVRITGIEIEGFRGFRQTARLTLARPNKKAGSGLTFVVGANNTGKSSIWESFEAVARGLKRSNMPSPNSDVSFSQGKRNHQTPTGVALRLELEDGRAFTLSSRGPNTSETKGVWTPPSNSPDAENYLKIPEIVSVPSRRQFQPNFSRGGIAERDWMTNVQEFARVRQNDQFTGRLFDLHNDESKKAKFDELMSTVLGYHLDWTIDLADSQNGPSYYLRVTSAAGVNHTSEGLGDGIISLLYILNALYDSEPDTLIVLDEPELSLHPQLVKRLGRVLAKFSEDRQIVVFTHSPQLISWDDIENGAEIARVHKRGADSHIKQASREAIKGVSSSRRGWRNPHVFGVDANEALFIDDGVIVVEGQEDAALLPRAFEFLNIELKGTIFGWGSGGVGNVPSIVRLLSDLGFERVAVILDNNVPGDVTKLREEFPEYCVETIPAPDIRDKDEYTNKKVEGLLDARGLSLKPHLRDEAHRTLSAVNHYLRPHELDVIPYAQ